MFVDTDGVRVVKIPIAEIAFYFISEKPVLLPEIIPATVLCEMLRGRLRFPNTSSSDVMLHLAPS